MEFLKDLYQRVVYYTVSYGELAFWSVMIVLVFVFIFGGK